MSKKQNTGAGDVSTSKKVDFLKDRDNYEENTENFQMKETHMSFLFLTAQHVYKMKKPVKYDLADFRTLEARRFNCMEEVRLNKRLAEEVYLEVLPLSLTEEGILDLGGTGKAVDWLVKMKRLDETQMLDFALKNNCLNEKYLHKAITKLSRFYKNSPPAEENPEKYLKKIKEKIKVNQEKLLDPDFDLSQEQLEDIFSRQYAYLKNESAVFKGRVLKGKVIEAHGDLKPEHVCLKEEPLIIDCLEFNKDLRILDTAEELSFLAVECELLGNENLGDVFFQIYREITGDEVQESLIHFYKSIQASQRTRFAIWHIKEAPYKNDPKWKKRAQKFLDLAQKYAEALK
ncbi:MAG TPA: hypothetical protein VIM94_00065 [Salegentibacter sp.]|uniref:hypothetical protein n=1 Tax=Salegentibacter sp. TaxID=1903072 RepID=UPI002F956E66